VARSRRDLSQIDTALVLNTRSCRSHFNAGIGLLRSREYWDGVLAGAGTVALLTSNQLLVRFPHVVEVLRHPLVVTVPDGEGAKSLAVVTEVYKQLADARFPRTGVLVGLGGGSVTDLAGFVAGTWKRGVRLIQAPTTLTSQVDAALGGKAGVNLAEGKNLVGVIYQPERVVADRGVLATVPKRDLLGGMAEIIKCGFIGDPTILDLVDRWSADRNVTGNRLRELINRSVQIKLGLVEEDEQDLDVRRHLNYGHTLGQALEAATGYRSLNHGEGVGLGMLYAAAVAELLGVASGLVDETRRQLEQVGLPTAAPATIDFETAWALMAQDKKSGSAGREFVLCERPGVARLISAPTEDIAREAFTVITGPAAGQETA
jgi:3-dehydroquinate synthase